MAATPFLTRGDTILLIATARRVSPEEMRPAIAKMESWGLKVLAGPSLYAENDQFAGSDDDRAADLQWAMDHPEARAIIIARGGYGTLRIIDRLDFSGFTKNPKWLIGFSDVTVLHSELYSRGFQSLHAAMPINFERSATATESLRRLLSGENNAYHAPPHELNRHGECTGNIFGGNLSLLYALKGTSSLPDLDGEILFIEDLDEYLYHVDRMVLSLKRARIFDRLAGVLVGGMSDMKDNAIPFGRTAEQIISSHLSDYRFPVCFNFPAGHIDENLAFRHGAPVNVKISAAGAIIEYL